MINNKYKSVFRDDLIHVVLSIYKKQLRVKVYSTENDYNHIYSITEKEFIKFKTEI